MKSGIAVMGSALLVAAVQWPTPRPAGWAVAAQETAPPAKKDASAGVGWLRGTWAFDDEYTTKKYNEREKTGDLTVLAELMVVAQLVEGLKGARMKVTDKEVIVTTKDGNGKAEPYEILDSPDANTLLLKEAGGKVTGYHREGERVWVASTGSVQVPFYFRRAR